MVLDFGLEKNIKHFFEEIPDSVEIIAVTKTVDTDRIRKAVNLGIKNIGENKVQEALSKFEGLKDLNLTWHLIGSLQSNKAKKAVEVFDLIHSIDSLKLANVVNKEAEKIGKVQNVLLQINVSEEETKSGFFIKDIFNVLPEIACLNNLNVIGLMTIGANTDNEKEVRSCFSELSNLKEIINRDKYFKKDLNILSMGMTNDYEIAIEEGSTMVRLGRAIFGERKIN